MDYLKQMNDTGVIDFDEMDDRIDEMKEKKREKRQNNDPITVDHPDTKEEPTQESGQSHNTGDEAHDLTKRVNNALSKVQETHNRELNKLEQRHENLKAHLKELKNEINDLQDDHEQTKSQVKRLSDPPSQAPRNHESQHPHHGNQAPQTQQPPASQQQQERPTQQQQQNHQPQKQSRGQPKEQGKADPKTSDYDSDDVALNKVFNANKTL